MRVLVVEDDSRMAAAVRRGLRGHGLVVDVAGDGDEALLLGRATDFDAVILAVMLPGTRGGRIESELT